MERKNSNSSRSTLGELASEKHDPLLDHMKNADAMNGQGIDLHRQSTESSNTDLEAQSMERPLTRADTAAWVTKHPSRIPDDGKAALSACANSSDAQEGSNVYRRV